MTAKKVAAKKSAPKKAAEKKAADKTEDRKPQTADQSAPEVEGEAYQVGFHGVAVDEADYSMAAEVARLSQEQ